MLKQVVSQLNYSMFAEMALIVFMIGFTAIVWRVCRMGRESTDLFASIPLTDAIVEPRIIEANLNRESQ